MVLTKLARLDLYGNSLKTLDITPLRHCSNLKFLEVDKGVELIIYNTLRSERLLPALSDLSGWIHFVEEEIREQKKIQQTKEEQEACVLYIEELLIELGKGDGVTVEQVFDYVHEKYALVNKDQLRIILKELGNKC